jgi:hypothetical protein
VPWESSEPTYISTESGLFSMPEERRLENFFELEIGDWPGGTLNAITCAFPEAPDGGIDLALPYHCEEHGRTIWWCLNASTFWCDGGPPEYAWHPCPAGAAAEPHTTG